MPKVSGILETCLYVDDLRRSVEFYERVFEFDSLGGDDRFHAFDVAGRDVLLLFKKGGTLKPVQMPFGVIPEHDGSGENHFAFGITPMELPRWEQFLTQQRIAIESRVTWPRAGVSLYFRDPDRHLIELLTPGVWKTY
jgi:catechol 2,3-dioxygenase-like lactoylglutathione lyase family enzyme